MADLSGDGTAFHLVTSNKRFDEALMEAERSLDRIGKLRFVPGNLGVLASGFILASGISYLPKSLRSLVLNGIDESCRTSYETWLGTQIRSDDC